MNHVERLEALLARVQNNAAALAQARAQGEWVNDAEPSYGANGHAEAVTEHVAEVALAASSASAEAEVDAATIPPSGASVRPEPSTRPVLALESTEEQAHPAPPQSVRGESGELLAVEGPVGEADLEAEIAASETSGTWEEPEAPAEQSGTSWPAPEPANDAAPAPEASVEAEASSWEPPPARAEAISGSWAHEQPPAPDWQEATPAPAPTWQAEGAAPDMATAELEYEERARRTPPPESGPQISPPGKLGVPDIDIERPISVAGEHIAVEQLGGTVDLEPATSGSLEMLAADHDAPRVAMDDYEEALPRTDTGAVFDESLAPPPNVANELAAMDRARLEKATRLSAVPEVAMTVAADTIAVPPPAQELETGILLRSPVPASVTVATFEGQRRATAHTFLELLDDSLGLGR